ncbi:MAG: 50S ribosomal protein L10 [Dehalococcoidales bacterium]|nr:50S ribosomal protein L10 [Dehalococcoidales bacterium]MDP7109463.1 50S ribosomal protein L10 [Dehalococcoidales bacterium]MDP7309979.1 50S ribosomal protein L10 [Dehalococcoidales bacterium]MDP7409998.1 50S ribosomal protein L10 [Dehalococcoidales bacterium]MDP7676025.1 50S ribosomal protein L10 [Dehalococcoidales bacterium]|tara:strand:+ start:5118 stop:5642 length:525 start_codon:yes stop_codon:yes gene_type:complete
MPTEKKAQIIENIKEAFAKSNIIILTHYQGLTTAELTALRRKLQTSNNEYQIVKNTLFRLAAIGIDKGDLVGSITGPTAVVFGYGEITAPAKVLATHISTSKSALTIKGGFLGDRSLTSAEVMTLATLPPREILLAITLGTIKSPIAALVGCLTTPMRSMVGVLQARIKQLEGV